MNAAVSDTSGEIAFTYDVKQLGGGHIHQSGEPEAGWVVETVKQIKIDDVVDAETQVDLVKIDVEGHELHVLKGMYEVIRRSPSIRIILEYYTYSEQVTPWGQALLDYIWSIGLTACRIEGNGSLGRLLVGEVPTGNCYLFVTKTPEADIARSPNSRMLKMKGFSYHAVFENCAHPLVQPDGTLLYVHRDHIGKEEPTLFFGPYIPLKKGLYHLNAIAEAQGNVHLNFVHRLGQVTIASCMVENWNEAISIEVPEDVTDFEIVARRMPDLERLHLSSMELVRVR